MSGICGVWQQRRSDDTREVLTTVLGGLQNTAVAQSTHQHVDGAAGVGIVASSFDTQELLNTPQLLIACDLELRNLTELRALCGVSATTRPISILALLYERFGCQFIDRLRGAFSIVLWDRNRQTMLAAIDDFGIKRLVWRHSPNGLLISSRVDALARACRSGLEVNPRAIVNVLNFTTNLGPETIFKGIHRLQPGSLLTASLDGVRVQQFWDMKYGEVGSVKEQPLAKELERLVQASVATQCDATPEHTIGAFLSGGTDSSTVVGMMSRVANEPVNAFSIGFEEQAFNELAYAELAAKRFKARHYTYLVNPNDCFSALPAIVGAFDEPFGNSSAIPTYFCAKLAADNGVTTLLGGDGGDELFAGNERYVIDKVFDTYFKLPPFLRKSVIEPLLGVAALPDSLLGRPRRYVRRANISGVERMLSFQFLYTHSLTEVFDPGFLEALDGYTVGDIPARHYRAASAGSHLDRLLYVDTKITLADSDLPKVTSMCDLAGVQARFPFLDRAVAEFSGTIPAALKIKGFDKRYIFKRAFRELLPKEILYKKKHGFGIPVANWLKSDAKLRELARDSLLSRRFVERGYFHRSFVEELFRKQDQDDTSFFGDTLWAFLALELWHHRCVDTPSGVAAA